MIATDELLLLGARALDAVVNLHLVLQMELDLELGAADPIPEHVAFLRQTIESLREQLPFLITQGRA